MQIFNKGKRQIDHIKPEQTEECTEEHGKRLLELFPDEVIEVGAVKAPVEEKAEVQEEIDEASAKATKAKK